jgi:hypothetical protein
MLMTGTNDLYWVTVLSTSATAQIVLSLDMNGPEWEQNQATY